MRRSLLLLAALALLLVSLLASPVVAGPVAAGSVAAVGGPAVDPADPITWVCHPGLAADQCRIDMTTTVQHADGTSTVRTPAPARRPVDCFFVYPTVSDEPTPNASGLATPEVQAIVRLQAARFSQVCRVYAPTYRQRTIAGLQAGQVDPAIEATAYQEAYTDVRAAWHSYLQRYNHGRGVVLIGHSQGSRLLRWLVREEIDPRPAVRSRLVSAILPGANVLVRRGSDRGGDFAHVPVCRRAAQTGCVLAWSSFGTPPPDPSRFGRPPSTDDGTGLPVGARYDVVCTNPASIAANRRRVVRPLLRSEPFPGAIGVLLVKLFNGVPPTAATPWLSPPDRYAVRCESGAPDARGVDAHWLDVQPVANSRALQSSPDATWGLHLADLNLVLPDLLAIVRAEVRAYGSKR